MEGRREEGRRDGCFLVAIFAFEEEVKVGDDRGRSLCVVVVKLSCNFTVFSSRTLIKPCVIYLHAWFCKYIERYIGRELAWLS